MVGTPRAVYYFADYEESKYQGRQQITRQHVTVPETVGIGVGVWSAPPRAVYYFADYEESKYQGRQRITKQHVTVPETVPTKVNLISWVNIILVSESFYFTFLFLFFFLFFFFFF
jgi:hypothetical protein